ncbi:helix-turn-helix domain-containing protein [Fischerella sp. PCC 9605]|uniref:helix-turn-helix domain-containing protein n=1 Tax=Fischerella sp. PCC 9605 TaxID=1173024 RepID=UPI000479C133|nr:helix-turn-helix domain-containing protein [Fischerella sp. PCC 9605]
MQMQGISLAEAARRLGVSQSALYVAVQKGQIPAFRRGRRTVISQAGLRAYQVRQRPTSDYRL